MPRSHVEAIDNKIHVRLGSYCSTIVSTYKGQQGAEGRGSRVEGRMGYGSATLHRSVI